MAKPSSLIRWSGPASIMGAVLLVVQIALSSILGPAQGTSNLYEIYNLPLFVIYNLLFDAALLLFAVGLVGLHARQAGRSGWLGRLGSSLAMIAAVALIISAFAAIMVGLWPTLYVPLAFFTQLLAGICLIVGLALLGVTTAGPAALRDWRTPGLHWRALLLILAVGLGAALLSDVLERIINSSYLGLRGNHLLHVLVTVPVAAWVARKVGTTPVLYGLLVGLISGIANQIFNHAILQPGTMRWYEMLIILVSCVVAGGLGGVIARYTLAEQETLYRASQAIGVVASLQDIVDAIGEHLADPQVSHVTLWQDISETEDDAAVEISLLAVWMPWAARVWGPGVWRPGLRLGTTQVPALANLRRQSQLVLRTSKLPASERAVWEHQGIRSAVLLPLFASSGARVGLLMVASRSYGLSKVKERTYMTIGAQVALVLENLRLVEQAQQAGVSSERQRLSQEIHDTLAQAFTSIVMKLEAAEGALPSNLNLAQRLLDQARNIARESLAEARRLMWALRPESLERSSLPETLTHLAERWAQECGAKASTTVTGTPHPLTPDTEVTLLRVAQEALNNCRKYAQARQVALTLSYMNNLVTLNVQDDGVGFDPTELQPDSSAQSTGGFGLMGMRERIEQLRGTLLVESSPGEGTTLMVAIPVAADKRMVQNIEATKASSLPGKETP
jgi:signal transduction histidine kinase